MKGLILLDWDNTIVDEEVQINDPRLKEMIQTKIEQGWQIGLNSDTPLRRLQGWWSSLHMNGPIIAERGAIVWWSDGQTITLSQTAALFSQFRKDMMSLLTQLEGHALFFGDSTEFIRSVSRIVSNDSAIVALDAYRVCSLGLFVRRISNERLTCDIPTTEKVYELMKSIKPSLDRLGHPRRQFSRDGTTPSQTPTPFQTALICFFRQELANAVYTQ